MDARGFGPLSTAVFLLLLSLPVPGCVSGVDAQSPRMRFGLSVSGDTLFMGPRAFLLRAVEAPELGDPRMPLEDKVRALNVLAGNGLNGVVIPLDAGFCGPTTDGSEWLTAFLLLTGQTRLREMCVVLRMAPSCPSPDAFGPREAAAAAAALGESWDVLFWFPQGEPKPYLNAFNERTDGFATAAARDASVLVTEGPLDRSEPRPILAVGGAVDGEDPDRHRIFSDPADASRVGEAGWPPDDPLPLRALAGEMLGPEEAREGFVPLFDGRTLTGWTVTRDPEGWAVEGGEIVWKRRGGGFLRSSGRFGDFILRLEWRIVRGGNSGVFLRSPSAGRASRIGMEIQMLGDSGSAPHKSGTGAVYDVLAPLVNAALPEGEWNRLEVYCRGPELKVWLNGQLIQDVDLDAHPELRPRLRRGFIQLQDHGHPVAFRNIRLKPLEEVPDPEKR